MRKAGLDLCRVVACLAVVAIHTLMLFWDFDPASPDWAVYNLLTLAVRCGVPLFFLLSGALLLGRETLDCGRLLRRAGHFLLLFYLWSALLYGIDALWLQVWTAHGDLLWRILGGYYHLWFLPALAMCYAALPLLHGLLHKNREKLRRGVLPLVIVLILGTLSLLPNLPAMLTQALRPYTLKNLCYLVYFLLGWLLMKHPLSGRRLTLLGLAALGAILLFAWLNRRLALEAGQAVETYYGYLTPSALLAACFVFALCLHLEKAASAHAALLQKLSGCTLGVYLLHPLFIDILRGSNLELARYSALWFFPLCYLSFVLLPLALTLLMQKVPLLNRLIT